jgi:hypothetical protein
MKWIQALLAKLSNYFRSGKAQQDAETALKHVGVALPYIDIAARIVTTLTPTGVDDAAWAYITKSYPRLFDGSAKTDRDLKFLAFDIASDLVRMRYPQLDTSIARAATQMAYLEHRAVPVEVAK